MESPDSKSIRHSKMSAAAFGFDPYDTYLIYDSVDNTDLNHSVLMNWTTGNWTNGTGEPGDDPGEVIPVGYQVAVSLILGIMILATIIGNVFVIAAILLEQKLQSPANKLILSLAVADTMVASLVMPLSAVYEVSHEWFLGQTLCDMWTSLDVLCCTASILHLVAIAMDRYWAISSVAYIQRRTSRQIWIMIIIVWLVSAVISIAPLFGWRNPELDHIPKQCMISQDPGYQLFATFGAFYLPLGMILFVYYKIWRVASTRLKKRPGGAPRPARLAQTEYTTINTATNATTNGKSPHHGQQAETTLSEVKQSDMSPEKSSSSAEHEQHGLSPHNGTQPPPVSSPNSVARILPKSPRPSPKSRAQHKQKSSSHDIKKERKAAKTLAIITGTFICCWLPFFITAVMRPLCPHCYFDPLMISIFLWLGYFNSILNPLIYTIFAPDFRTAFRKILFGTYTRNRRYR